MVGENPLNRNGKTLFLKCDIVYSYRKENNYKQFIRERISNGDTNRILRFKIISRCFYLDD